MEKSNASEGFNENEAKGLFISRSARQSFLAKLSAAMIASYWRSNKERLSDGDVVRLVNDEISWLFCSPRLWSLSFEL